ncbi:MAG: hypothetical protein ACRC6O_04635 [Flavobacterium sp.]
MKTWFLLFFQSATVLSIHAQQKEEVMMRGRITAPSTRFEEVTVKNENSNQFTTCDKNGFFSIRGKLGDLLQLTAPELEPKRKKISFLDYKSQSISIEMTPKIIALKEVVINTTASITAEKLGIIPENQKKYTPAERRLTTAGDFKALHLLGLLGGSLPLDPIINKLSGRTKRLKKEVALEQKEHLLKRLRSLFEDDFYTLRLKIARPYIEAFRYFCIENTFFVSYLTTGNIQLLELSMTDLAFTFNKNQLSEE